MFHGNQSEPTTTVDTSGTGHSTGTLLANVEGSLTGNASTATALASARTIAIAGDVVGSASFDGTGNISINSTIQADSVVLGTDTTGNFLRELSAGQGIDITHTASEGSTATIAAELATETNAGVATFDGTDFTVSTGDVTLKAERIQDIAGAMFTGNTETGITVTYDDSDGTIDAVVSLASFDTDNLSEGSSNLYHTPERVQDIVGAMFSSNTETGITVTYQDADNTIDLAVGTVALGSGTSGNYVDNVTGGTGVTVTGSAGEGWEPAISIGQAVSTTSDVTFADIAATDITAGGNVVITGNLTVNGSSVTNSSTNTTIEDALIELGSGNTGSNSNDLGLILERGSTGNNAFMGWDESADKFVMGTTTATGSSTGGLTVTTGTLVANIEGNVTGNVSGSAATVTGAAQSAITSVGTLSSLAVSGNQTVGGTLGVTGAATTSYTTIGASAKAFRNTFIHSSAPSGSDGAVGDIWITYS